jgi:hypothetical protein
MKYSRNVFGQVVSLGVGAPAVVRFADGTTMTTSIVEEIVAADATSVTFATKNSVYTVQDFQCIGVERSVSSSYYAPKIGESYTFTNKSGAVIGIGIVVAIMRDEFFNYVFTANGKVYMIYR